MDKLSRYAPYALAALRIVTALLFMQHGTAKLFGFPEMAGHGGGGPGSPGGLSLLMFVGALAGTVRRSRHPRRVPDAARRPSCWPGKWRWPTGVCMCPRGGFFPLTNGGDLAVLFCFVFLYLVFAGPGAFSLDGARAPARASS